MSTFYNLFPFNVDAPDETQLSVTDISLSRPDDIVPAFTLTVTCDLSALLSTFELTRNVDQSESIETRGETEQWLRLARSLEIGDDSETNIDMTLTTHPDENEIINLEGWGKYWYYLISKTFRPSDNQGASAKVSTIDHYLASPDDARNPLLKETRQAIGTPLGSRTLNDRPDSRDHYLANLAVLLMEQRGNNVAGDLGSLDGDVTQGFRKFQFKDDDSLWWYHKSTLLTHTCTGIVHIKNDPSKKKPPTLPPTVPVDVVE